MRYLSKAGGWSTTLFHLDIIPSTVLRVISVLLVITRSYIRMSYGTSDSTVISPITTEAHNLNTVNASAASRDDVSPANVHAHTPKNCRLQMLYNRLLMQIQTVSVSHAFPPLLLCPI